MNKRSKLLCVWIAVSAVILIAGIVLFALFGFNNLSKKFKFNFNHVSGIRRKQFLRRSLKES